MAQAIYELDPIGVDGALEAVAIHWYCNEGCASRAKIDGSAVPKLKKRFLLHRFFTSLFYRGATK